MTILFMGFLGAGKSSIGTLLAQKLGYSFVELDDVALSKTSYNSVQDAYVKNIGEWREKQLEASKELSNRKDVVVISNGAMIDNEQNLKYFKENAKDLKIIYIKTNPTVLTNRLINLYDEFKKDGPNMVLKTMSRHFDKRDDLYTERADLIINTEDSTPSEACDEILQKLKN